jgi:hypothetical protein
MTPDPAANSTADAQLLMRSPSSPGKDRNDLDGLTFISVMGWFRAIVAVSSTISLLISG